MPGSVLTSPAHIRSDATAWDRTIPAVEGPSTRSPGGIRWTIAPSIPPPPRSALARRSIIEAHGLPTPAPAPDAPHTCAPSADPRDRPGAAAPDRAAVREGGGVRARPDRLDAGAVAAHARVAPQGGGRDREQGRGRVH